MVLKKQANQKSKTYNLLIDIGGTNARFCLEGQDHNSVLILPTNNYPNIEASIFDYLKRKSINLSSIKAIAIAIANPVEGDWMSMTNHHWQFSINQLKKTLKVPMLKVINDFVAIALSVPELTKKDLIKIGGGTAQANGVIGVIGPGTGLGVGGLIKSNNHWIPINSEGGHTMFSPANNLEIKILNLLLAKFPHLSFERLVSGPGIELIYNSIRQIQNYNKKAFPLLSTPEIVELSQNKLSPLAIKTTEIYSEILGSFAGNLAITLGCNGGLYLGGGVLIKMKKAFNKKLFRQRFEAKGRFKKYMQKIPIYLITCKYPAFMGLAKALKQNN